MSTPKVLAPITHFLLFIVTGAATSRLEIERRCRPEIDEILRTYASNPPMEETFRIDGYGYVQKGQKEEPWTVSYRWADVRDMWIEEA